MRVVTSGQSYLDIDAYDGCVAYAELLQLLGIDACAASSAPLNKSVSSTVRAWKAPLLRDYIPRGDDSFTLIDISNPEWVDRLVDVNKIDEVIDHHLGFEIYWQQKIGKKAHIEFIGAACTLVYERWQKAGLLDKISQLSARLLICGILDNTLNFKAQVTTDRDRAAYRSLLPHANLPADWPARYFAECQQAILKDAAQAVENDTKIVTFKSFAQPLCVGQLAVWDATSLTPENRQAIQRQLLSHGQYWCINLISIRDGKSYFLADDQTVKLWLTKLLGLRFEGEQAIAKRLWLRKEIIKADIDASH